MPLTSSNSPLPNAGAEELYDILIDPHCMRNLADNPEYASTKKSLWQQLSEQLVAQSDPRMLGYGDIIDSYPFFGRIQNSIPGFKEPGKYNSTYWPPDRGPVPVLDVD